MRRLSWSVALGVALVPSLAACAALLSIDEVGYGGDAAADAGGPLTEAGDAGACPGRAGPRGVNVGAFCIDETEVTNSDYALFVADASLQDQPSECDWNERYIPTCVENSQASELPWPRPQGWETFPVSCVDWCDAYAYCRWAGKRLCGRIGGGANAASEIADPASDQGFSRARTTEPSASPTATSTIAPRAPPTIPMAPSRR